MDDGSLDVKLVILGATDVGKTSLTMRYCHGSFNHPTSATIGASYLQKRIVLDNPQGGGQTRMTLQIWDTAGQERFRSMAPMYYRNAKAAILVFDIAKGSESFEKAKEWLDDLKPHVGPDVVLSIVGNKCDVASEFEFATAQEYAESIGARAFETSALSGQGVDAVFNDTAKRLLEKIRAAREAAGPNIKAAGNRGAGASAGMRLNDGAARGGSKGCCS